MKDNGKFVENQGIYKLAYKNNTLMNAKIELCTICN